VGFTSTLATVGSAYWWTFSRLPTVPEYSTGPSVSAGAIAGLVLLTVGAIVVVIGLTLGAAVLDKHFYRS
jgi:hypothetical protein